MSDAVRYVQVSPNVAASPQIRPEHVSAIAEAGFKVLLNNRPDGEVADQPDSESMRDAAEAAGLKYVFYPVDGYNFPGHDIASVKALFDDKDSSVFAYCRSGTRSCNLWILSQTADEVASAREHAQGLGFDVSMSLPR